MFRLGKIILTLGSRGYLNWVPDSIYLKIIFNYRMNERLNLKSPQTFNQKLQWLKLYNRNPIYTTMVDKYAVRQYIEDKIGNEYLIPLVGGPWKTFEEIDFNALPDQFVLKSTHDSGGLVICRDKSKLDIDEARKKITISLGRNYYNRCREWPYKDVLPQIIAEKYMTDGSNTCLPVYKIFCFDGQPKIIQTIQNDKLPGESVDYFDPKWNLLKMRQNFPNSVYPLKKPEQLKKMLEIAKTLSTGHSFIRVDLYTINMHIKFSEYTFFSDSGLEKFYPESWDMMLGGWLTVPVSRRVKSDKQMSR